MPALLDGVINIPVVYEPWYLYQATLISTPASFVFMDVLFPNSVGAFDLLVTDVADLSGGYAFAAQTYDGSQTTCQVLIPGSVVPFVSDNSLKPCCMVKVHYASSTQTVVLASAADFAAGKVIGRYRYTITDNLLLNASATNGLVVIHSGLA